MNRGQCTSVAQVDSESHYPPICAPRRSTSHRWDPPRQIETGGADYPRMVENLLIRPESSASLALRTHSWSTASQWKDTAAAGGSRPTRIKPVALRVGSQLVLELPRLKIGAGWPTPSSRADKVPCFSQAEGHNGLGMAWRCGRHRQHFEGSRDSWSKPLLFTETKGCV